MAPTILDELKIENREKILEFLIFYSRFEYALKRTRNVKTKNGDAEANFEKFVAKNADKFNPKRTKVIEEAVNYLLEFPAKKQIVEDYQLKFVENPATQHGPIALRVFQCIRTTRNNLFCDGEVFALDRGLLMGATSAQISQREICNGDRTNQTCFRSWDNSNL